MVAVKASEKGTLRLAGINYELGAPTKFDTLKDREEILDRLRARGNPADFGLHEFRVMKGDMFDAAILTAKKTIADARIAPAEIDGVVLCTSTVTETIGPNRHNLAYFLQELGLTYAYPLGVTFSTCANFPAGLKIASALLKEGSFKNILLIALDKYAKSSPTFVSQDSRFTPSYVCSDGAGSALLSASIAAQYDLMHVELAADVGLLEAGIADEARVLKYLALLRKTCSELLAHEGLTAEKIRQYFVGNYFYGLFDSFRGILRLEEGRIFRENVPRIGHCYAADNLINLRDFVDRYGCKKGDLFVLVSAGLGQVGASLLRVDNAAE